MGPCLRRRRRDDPGRANLQLPGERRLGLLERDRRLTLEEVPPGEVLFEAFSAGRRQHHALSFECEPCAVLREARILSANFLEKVPGLLQLPQRFLAQLRHVDAARALAPPQTAALARCLLRAPAGRPLCRPAASSARPLIELVAQRLGPGQLLGQLPRVVLFRREGSVQTIREAIELMRDLLLRAGLRASGWRRRPHLVRRFLHPVHQPCDVASRFSQRSVLLIGLPTPRRAATLLLQVVLKATRPIREAFLVAGQTTQRVLAGLTCLELTELGGNLSLAVRQLLRFELHLAGCASLVVRSRRLQTAFKVAQLLECAARVRPSPL